MVSERGRVLGGVPLPWKWDTFAQHIDMTGHCQFPNSAALSVQSRPHCACAPARGTLTGMDSDLPGPSADVRDEKPGRPCLMGRIVPFSVPTSRILLLRRTTRSVSLNYCPASFAPKSHASLDSRGEAGTTLFLCDIPD